MTVAFVCGPWFTPLQVQGVDIIYYWLIIDQFAKMVDVLEFVVVVALFDMPNSYQFDILSISIFSEISLSISISIFSKISLSISIFSKFADISTIDIDI